MQKIIITALSGLMLVACGSKKNENNTSIDEPSEIIQTADFNADSAYSYIEKQVKFGPRVPNTEAHKATAKWLEAELKRHGADVTIMPCELTAFDGTKLSATNIIGMYNPDKEDRTLFVAHWDCRPWADQDPDQSLRTHPVDGANDGASGVGVLLEMARQFALRDHNKGVDILFVDAEDYGEDGKDDSWALGAQNFVKDSFKKGYYPSRVILLDMVGGTGATFRREYFSQQSAPQLLQEIWNIAQASGYQNYFINSPGGAVTDDHVQFIEGGIPAIDIIDYRIGAEEGFHPSWHTSKDNMDAISKETLKAVGQTLLNYLYR